MKFLIVALIMAGSIFIYQGIIFAITDRKRKKKSVS